MLAPRGYLLTAVEMPEAAWELLKMESVPNAHGGGDPTPV